MRRACCLSVSVTMPRSLTTPKRLRSGTLRRPSTKKVGVSPTTFKKKKGAVSPTTIKKLRVDMLRGYLASYQLPTTGSKQQLVDRLTNYVRSHATRKIQRSRVEPSVKSRGATHTDAPPVELIAANPLESSDSNSNGDDTDNQDPPSGDQGSSKSSSSDDRHTTKRQKHSAERHSGSSPSGGHRARKRRASRTHSPSSKRRRYYSSSSESEVSPPRHRRRRRDSSPSTSSTSSYTSSSTSSSYRCRRHRRKHRSRRRRHRSSRDAAIASISCAPPLSGHMQDRIKRGKYINFDKLLLPPLTPPLFTAGQTSTKQRKTEKRQVTGLTSWLEAWNRYATCRIASDSAMALELVKYQTVVSLLFARYPAVSVIEYDRLFRQAAARDRTMRWDCPKEDIYVWALTQSRSSAWSHISLNNNPSSTTGSSLPFRDRVPITARLGPPVKPTTTTVDRATHASSGKEICKRFNLGKCTKGDDCIFAHICWHSNCQGDHPGKGCPKRY